MDNITTTTEKRPDDNFKKYKPPQLLKELTNEELQKLGEFITPQIVMGMLSLLIADCINTKQSLGIVSQVSTQVMRGFEIINKITERDLDKASDEKLNKKIIDLLGEDKVA